MATAPAPPPAQPLDLAKLTEVYRKIRDAKDERRKAWEADEEEFDRKLMMIEGVLLTHLNAHGVDSVATQGGTFFRVETIKPNIVDDKAFYEWIKENDAFDALQRRVAVGTIKAFMEAHDGGLPPGIRANREWEVRVRKPAP